MKRHYESATGNRNPVIHRDWTRDVRARILNKVRENSDITYLLKEYRLYRMSSISVQSAKIVQALHELGAARVHDLASKCRITPHIVSAQLSRLSKIGYVKSEPKGRERYYSIKDEILSSSLVLLNSPSEWRAPTERQLLDSLSVDYPDVK
jgi:DNA-binding MarR family transcriptional regulator